MRFRLDPSTPCEPCRTCGGKGGWSSRHRDDRGLRFEGDASALLAFVKTGMKPWNKGAQAKV